MTENVEFVTNWLWEAGDALMKEVNLDPTIWDDITVRQDYPGSAHADTQAIYLRGPRAFTPHLVLEDLGSYDYPAMSIFRDEVVALMKPLMDKLKVKELGRMMIVNLPATGWVTEHTDEGAYAEHFDRWHLVLKSNEECVMKVGGVEHALLDGELWQINNRRPHSAWNHGDTDRWHLIFDATVEK